MSHVTASRPVRHFDITTAVQCISVLAVDQQSSALSDTVTVYVSE